MRNKITFIHTADIHFGMENYGKIDPKTGIHSRLIDFQKALHECIDHAIARDVDFFMFSGDAYKTPNPSPTHQRLLSECFFRLFKHDIPIVMVIGNHDHPLTFGKSHALEIFGQLPLEGFHVISKPENITLQTKHGPIQITGIPWPTRAQVSLSNEHQNRTAAQLTEIISNSIADIIRNLADKLDSHIPAILAGHLTVSSGIFSGSEKRAVYGNDPVLLPSQLAIEPYEYVALGHLHRYQNLNPNAHPAIVYSGSIERIDFGERKEEKGFCLVTIHEKNNTTHEFIQVATRPFIQIEIMLNDDSSHTEQILAHVRKHPISNAVLKIVYTLPAHIKDRVDAHVIHNACETAHYVVGIFPIRPIVVKESRASLKVDMNLQELMLSYCATKPEYLPLQDDMIKKALELVHEIEQEEHSS